MCAVKRATDRSSTFTLLIALINVSVMELLARHDASKATQQMLLDSFLNGFLFKLFEQKYPYWSSNSGRALSHSAH